MIEKNKNGAKTDSVLFDYDVKKLESFSAGFKIDDAVGLLSSQQIGYAYKWAKTAHRGLWLALQDNSAKQKDGAGISDRHRETNLALARCITQELTNSVAPRFRGIVTSAYLAILVLLATEEVDFEKDGRLQNVSDRLSPVDLFYTFVYLATKEPDAWHREGRSFNGSSDPRLRKGHYEDFHTLWAAFRNYAPYKHLSASDSIRTFIALLSHRHRQG